MLGTRMIDIMVLAPLAMTLLAFYTFRKTELGWAKVSVALIALLSIWVTPGLPSFLSPLWLLILIVILSGLSLIRARSRDTAVALIGIILIAILLMVKL